MDRNVVRLSTRQYIATKAIIWTDLVALASMITLGLFYFAALLTNSGVFLSLVEPIAYSFGMFLVDLAIIFLFVSIIARIAIAILNRRRLMTPGLIERLQRLGTQALIQMQFSRKMMFIVRKRLAGAYLRRDKIVVGDQLMLQSTDDDIIAFIAHELGHLLKKRYSILRRFVNTIQVIVVLAAVALYKQQTVFISGITIVCVMSFVNVLIHWRAEYSADAVATKYLGSDRMAHALESLGENAYRGLSFTHPRLASRIKRIQGSQGNAEPRISPG